MKRLLRITVLFSVTLLWWGEKGYAATPAMDAAEKETVSATVEAEADKKDPKSDKKSDEPKRKRNLGHLSGSFETNTIYYVEDSKTGAVVPHNSYGSNNFLKLDYQLGRFSAGVQLEYYPHPLVGTPMQGYEYVMEGFSINNLTEKYISWTDRNYSVTVGDFYEQFGSGLILRAWEDRALGFNNSLGGARVTFNIKDIVEGKVLYAFPRFNLGYLSTQIAGGDLSFSLSNAIGLLDHRLSLEGSIVNRHFKNLPSWYTEYRDDYDFDLSKNVISYSGRVNYEYRGLSAKFEYVGKSKDVYLDNMTGEEVFKRGDAQLFEIGYTGSNYAVMAQFRRLNYMQSQLYRPDGGSGAGLPLCRFSGRGGPQAGRAGISFLPSCHGTAYRTPDPHGPLSCAGAAGRRRGEGLAGAHRHGRSGTPDGHLAAAGRRGRSVRPAAERRGGQARRTNGGHVFFGPGAAGRSFRGWRHRQRGRHAPVCRALCPCGTG